MDEKLLPVLKTEEDIWRIAEEICGRLKELGSDTVVMTVNTQREITQCKSSHTGSVFLEKNPDCLQRFKDFCVKIYGSSNEAIGEKDQHIDKGDNVDQSKPCMAENNQSECTITSSDEDTEDYSDYETIEFKEEQLIVKETKKKILKKPPFENCEQKDIHAKCKSKHFKECETVKPRRTRRIVGNKQNDLKQSLTINKRLKKKKTESYRNLEISGKPHRAENKCILSSPPNMDSSKSKKGETTQDANKINRSDEEIGQEKPAVNDKPKGRTVYKQIDKITCPICQTEWTGQISYVNHLRVHKDYQLCTMCEELIPINNITMAIHIREKHSGKNPYKCKICGRGYKTKNGVKNHYVSVHADSSARYWCELCDRAFGTKNNYTSHMRSHKGGNKCFICVQKFDDKNLLCTHMRDCHANYLCLICSSYFADLSELRQHESSHTEKEREFGINVDIRQFYGSTEAESTENDDTENTEYKLMQNSSDIIITENMHFEKQPDLTETATREITHNNSNRKSVNKVDDHGGTARKSFKCKFCGRVFKVAMHFTRHIRLHNNKSNFTCQHCEKVCKNEETFKHHIALHLPDDKKPHQCEHCSKGFVTSTSLKKHLLVHSKAKDYICEFCGKAFRDTTKLQIHRRSHTGERPYKCKSCTKSYRSWDALKNHQQVHQPKISYMCDTCGKLYTQKHRLHEHKRTHREDGLKCDVCGLQNLSVGAVRRHLVLEHLEIAKERGYKIYTCEYCKKILPNKEKYDYHIRIHTGARPFGCTECKKSFRDKKQLKMHKRIHTKEKKYECTVCNKFYQYNRTLKKHMLSHDTNSTNQIVPQATYNNSHNSQNSVDPLSHTSQCEPPTFSPHIYNVMSMGRSHESHALELHEKSQTEIMQTIHHISNTHGYPMNYYPDRSINETYGSETQLHHQPTSTHMFSTLYPSQNLGESR